MSYRPPKVSNETGYDTRRIGAIVRFVFRELELDGRHVMVKVKHHTGGHAYQGRFYPQARRQGRFVRNGWGEYNEVKPSVPTGVAHLLVCRVGKPGVYPKRVHVYKRKDAPAPWVVENWQEALVSITGHEAMHLRQWQTKPRHVRGFFNEVDTEWAALRMLTAWRKTQ